MNGYDNYNGHDALPNQRITTREIRPRQQIAHTPLNTNNVTTQSGNRNNAVTWDQQQKLWRAAVVLDDGSERPVGWFKTTEEAVTFLQFLSFQRNSNPLTSNNSATATTNNSNSINSNQLQQDMYEKKMRHLESQLLSSKSKSNNSGSSNFPVAGRNEMPAANNNVNIDNKLKQVRFGNTNARLNQPHAKLDVRGSYAGGYTHSNAAGLNKTRKRNNKKIVDPLPVLPEWYRTMHAMKVLNLSRADVAIASGVPGNILSRFLNGNSHLPTHLHRIKNWLNKINRRRKIMTERESIEMAKVKRLTAIDIVPKTVRKRKRRSRRNIGRVGIQESFRQRQHVGLTRTQEEHEQLLLQQQRDVQRTRMLLEEQLQQYQQPKQQSNHVSHPGSNTNYSNQHYNDKFNTQLNQLLRTSNLQEQNINALSNKIYSTNNDGHVAFSENKMPLLKIPMYALPELGELRNAPPLLTALDLKHFQTVSKTPAPSKNITSIRSPMMKTPQSFKEPSAVNGNKNIRVGECYQALLPPCQENLGENNINSDNTNGVSSKNHAQLLWCSHSAFMVMNENDLNQYFVKLNVQTTDEIEHALKLLRDHGYNIKDALKEAPGSVLAGAKAASWTSSDRALFEIAIDKYGRDFQQISSTLSRSSANNSSGNNKQIFTVKDCIRYYYDEFKMSNAYELWKKNGKKNEQKIQDNVEPRFGNIFDSEDLEVDGGDDTTHHHLCMECRGTGELLMCDRCPNVSHLHCNKPFPLENIPCGQWFCYKCVVEDKITSRVEQYKYDRMHELVTYLSNPSGLDIYMYEVNLESKDMEPGATNGSSFYRNDFEQLARSVRVQYRNKAQIASKNYRQKQIQIQQDVKRYERKLRLQLKRAEENHGIVENDTTDSDQPNSQNPVEWSEYRDAEINKFIRQNGPAYPLSSFDRFKQYTRSTTNFATGHPAEDNLLNLWNNLPKQERQQYDNEFQNELQNSYTKQTVAFRNSNVYTAFIQVLDKESKAQFYKNTLSKKALQQQLKKLSALKKERVALQAEIERSRGNYKMEKSQALRNRDGKDNYTTTYSMVNSKTINNGKNVNVSKFFGVGGYNEFNNQISSVQHRVPSVVQHRVPSVVQQPVKQSVAKNETRNKKRQQFRISSISTRWEKKKRLLLKNYLREKGVIHPGAPYVMFTVVQRQLAKTDKSIKESRLQDGWTKEVKEKYTKLFNKKLAAYRKARADYEDNRQDYKDYLKHVNTVEKSMFYKKAERANTKTKHNGTTNNSYSDRVSGALNSTFYNQAAMKPLFFQHPSKYALPIFSEEQGGNSTPSNRSNFVNNTNGDPNNTSATTTASSSNLHSTNNGGVVLIGGGNNLATGSISTLASIIQSSSTNTTRRLPKDTKTAREWASYRKKQLVKFEKQQGANRPGSAYILFTMDERAKFKSTHPKGSHLHATDLAKMWANASKNVRNKYEMKFKNLKNLYVASIKKMQTTMLYKKYVKYLDSGARTEWLNSKLNIVDKDNATASNVVSVDANSNVGWIFNTNKSNESAVSTLGKRKSTASTLNMAQKKAKPANKSDKNVYKRPPWKKWRKAKIKAYMRENGPKRPVAPFLMYYMEKAKEAREVAASSLSKRIPLDRSKLAVEFDSLPVAKRQIYANTHDRNLASYHAKREELLNSNGYINFLYNLDKNGPSEYNLIYHNNYDTEDVPNGSGSKNNIGNSQTIQLNTQVNNMPHIHDNNMGEVLL
jgi:hypothetical protein